MVGAEYYLVWPALGRPNSLPNGARRNPQGFVLFLLYFSLNLVSYQHQVGPGVDCIREKVFVLSLQLQGMLVDILGVLLSYLLRVIARIFNLKLFQFRLLCYLNAYSILQLPLLSV